MPLSTSISNSENNHVAWMKRLNTALYRCVPILSWMPLYNADKFICDLIAGVTVGLTVIPQSLAYATLAGLEPQVCRNFVLNYVVFSCVLIYYKNACGSTYIVSVFDLELLIAMLFLT
jgi:sodium-independent sulfate anion transporter 11